MIRIQRRVVSFCPSSVAHAQSICRSSTLNLQEACLACNDLQMKDYTLKCSPVTNSTHSP